MKWNALTAGALVVLCLSLLYAQAPACLSFKEAVNIGTGLFASGVVIEDLNGDGAVDLAVTNQNSNNVSVLFGDGTGTFRGKTDFPREERRSESQRPILMATGSSISSCRLLRVMRSRFSLAMVEVVLRNRDCSLWRVGLS